MINRFLEAIGANRYKTYRTSTGAVWSVFDRAMQAQPPRSAPLRMTKISRAVILADDSAHWKIAGLRQLERRLWPSTNLAVARGEEIELYILLVTRFRAESKIPPAASSFSRRRVRHRSAGIRRFSAQHPGLSASELEFIST